MRRLTLFSKILAFSLVLVLLTIRIGSFSQVTFVQPVQDVIFQTAKICEETAKSKPSALKPKRAAADAVANGAQLLIQFFPLETRLMPCLPYQSLPEVYLDIFIPPDERA